MRSSNDSSPTKEFQQKKAELGDSFEIEYFGESKSTRKHRLSFLDTLLLAMDKDKTIDMAGCCEEVDTFMFEGKTGLDSRTGLN